MRVLVACEHSGRVRSAFRALGHDAYSCDLELADDSQEYHIQGDCLPVIAQGWDLVIAHPPCTHLCSSGAKHFAAKRADGRQAQGIALFMAIRDACEAHASRWAIENPVGIMSSLWRKPDQIVQPYMFGDEARKATCFWLHDLVLLTPTNVVGHGEMRPLKDGRTMPAWYTTKGKHRQVTFPGMAKAMASQWGSNWPPLLDDIMRDAGIARNPGRESRTFLDNMQYLQG